jgi:glycosyltransferase involved in cell wall biosynthesis
MRGHPWLTRVSARPSYRGSEEAPFILALESLVASASDHTFAITEQLKSLMVEHGLEAHRCSVLPNGVEPKPVGYRRKPDPSRFAYIGSVMRYEGTDVLLRAVSILRQTSDRPLRVDIVGEGDALRQTVEQSAALGLGDVVRFEGAVTRERALDHYSAAIAVVAPRHSLPNTEAIAPMKIGEALSLECCVVATSVAPVKQLIESSGGGYLVPPDHPPALAKKLAMVLDNPDAAIRRGVRGREWVERERPWSAVCRDTALERFTPGATST